MGKATIISGGEDGRYTIEVDLGEDAKAQRIADLTAKIAQKTAQIVAAEAALAAVEAVVATARVELNSATEAYIEWLTGQSPRRPRNEETRSPGLRTTVTVNKPNPAIDEEVTIDVTLFNQWPDPVQQPTVMAPIPAGLEFVSAETNSGTYDDSTGEWALQPASGNSDYWLRVTAIATNADPKVYTATATSERDDTAAGDDTDEVKFNAQPADIRLTKTVDVSTPIIGDEITFTVTVFNDGPGSAANLSVSDMLADGLAYISSIASGGSYDAASGQWQIGSLASGAWQTLQITARVERVGSITDFAVADADELDPDAGNNEASAAIDVPATYLDIEYGSALFPTAVGAETLICGQNANVYFPPDGSAPRGCILWFPGGSWYEANKDSADNHGGCAALAAAGYLVVNANYRQATDGSGPGVYVGQGGYYDDGVDDGIYDAMKILRLLISPDSGDAAEAAGFSQVWTSVRAYIAEHGLLVAGVSAGGFMTVHATMRYGTATGNWPRAAFTFCGPMDITFLAVAPSDGQRAAVANYLKNYLPDGSPGFLAAQQDASPLYAMGDWTAAFAASEMELYIGYNENDTLVNFELVGPFVEAIDAIAPDRVDVLSVSEIWPLGATTPWPGNHNLTTPMERYVLFAATPVFG